MAVDSHKDLKRRGMRGSREERCGSGGAKVVRMVLRKTKQIGCQARDLEVGTRVS